MPSELQDDDISDDESDDVPSDLDGPSDEEDAEDVSQKEADDDGDESEDFDLAEGSDADDLLPLDAEVQMGLIDYDGSDSDGGGESDAEEWGGISSGPDGKHSGKRKRAEDGKKAQRKKLRSLPTFASYDDYAKLIEDGPEDNI